MKKIHFNPSGMSKTLNKTVLLLRAPKDGEEDTFEKGLLEHGYIPLSIPVLDFKFINIVSLSQRLSEIHKYSAIVFTSQRAVEAVVLALKQLADSKPTGEERTSLDLKCYAVGASTCKAAASCGFSPVGSDCGNAETLAEFISKDTQPSNMPILYPCGNLKKDTLSTKLKASGFSLCEVEVYETVKNEEIDRNVDRLVQQKGLPEFVVYFSPSGVKYTEGIVSSGLLPLSQVKVLAIGPTTEKELVSRNIPVSAVAVTPGSDGLITALSQASMQ